MYRAQEQKVITGTVTTTPRLSPSCAIAITTSAILNSAGGMGEGGLSTPEEGDMGEGADGGIGHKTQVCM